MDVDNKNDYAEMVKKIISEKLKKIKIFIDMKNVEKLPVSTHEASLENSSMPQLTKKQSSLGNAANHESGESEDEETVLVIEVFRLRRQILRFRLLNDASCRLVLRSLSVKLLVIDASLSRSGVMTMTTLLCTFTRVVWRFLVPQPW
jgi:hypothetical protein